MLKYIGPGYIVGIPARDLTDDELKKLNLKELIQSGIYTEVTHGNRSIKKDTVRGRGYRRN